MRQQRMVRSNRLHLEDVNAGSSQVTEGRPGLLLVQGAVPGPGQRTGEAPVAQGGEAAVFVQGGESGPHVAAPLAARFLNAR